MPFSPHLFSWHLGRRVHVRLFHRLQHNALFTSVFSPVTGWRAPIHFQIKVQSVGIRVFNEHGWKQGKCSQHQKKKKKKKRKSTWFLSKSRAETLRLIGRLGVKSKGRLCETIFHTCQSVQFTTNIFQTLKYNVEEEIVIDVYVSLQPGWSLNCCGNIGYEWPVQGLPLGCDSIVVFKTVLGVGWEKV